MTFALSFSLLPPHASLGLRPGGRGERRQGKGKKIKEGTEGSDPRPTLVFSFILLSYNWPWATSSFPFSPSHSCLAFGHRLRLGQE